jgi:hypothetical protein
MFAVEEPRDDRRDWTMDHAAVSLGRIERLEICLDRLSRGLLDICEPGYVPKSEVKDMLDRVRCVSSVIRGLQHCFDMRQNLQARQNSLAQSLQTPPPEPIKEKTSPRSSSPAKAGEVAAKPSKGATTPTSSVTPASFETPPANPARTTDPEPNLGKNKQKITGNIKAAKTMVADLKKISCNQPPHLRPSIATNPQASAPPPPARPIVPYQSRRSINTRRWGRPNRPSRQRNNDWAQLLASGSRPKPRI